MKDYLKMLLSLIMGVIIGKFTYSIFSVNIIMIRL